jgi:hypothetical protein
MLRNPCNRGASIHPLHITLPQQRGRSEAGGTPAEGVRPYRIPKRAASSDAQACTARAASSDAQAPHAQRSEQPPRAARTDPLPFSGLLFGDDAMQAVQQAARTDPLPSSGLLFGDDAMQAVQRAARTDPLPSSGLLFGDDAMQAVQQAARTDPLPSSGLLFGDDAQCKQCSEQRARILSRPAVCCSVMTRGKQGKQSTGKSSASSSPSSGPTSSSERTSSQRKQQKRFGVATSMRRQRHDGTADDAQRAAKPPRAARTDPLPFSGLLFGDDAMRRKSSMDSILCRASLHPARQASAPPPPCVRKDPEGVEVVMIDGAADDAQCAAQPPRAARTDPLPSSGLLFGDDAMQAVQRAARTDPLPFSGLLFGNDAIQSCKQCSKQHARILLRRH